MLFFSLNYCFAAVVLIATNKVEYIIQFGLLNSENQWQEGRPQVAVHAALIAIYLFLV